MGSCTRAARDPPEVPGTPLMCQGPPRGARDAPEVPGTPVSPGREVPARHGAAAPPPSLRLLLFPAELRAQGAFQAEPIPNISPESICKGKSSVLAPWPHPGLAAWVCKSAPRELHFITKHKGRGGVGWGGPSQAAGRFGDSQRNLAGAPSCNEQVQLEKHPLAPSPAKASSSNSL